MKKNIFKKVLIWSLFILWLASFWFLTYENLNTKIHYVNVNYIADFSDDRKLIWTADNVFVWKIITNKWLANQEWFSRVPETLFEVEVLYNIKWKINWNIIVKQEAGYDKYNNLYITEWNKYMEEWEIYLLATKADSYTIISHENWSHLISNNISKKDIKTIVTQNKKINDFRKAYKEELYYQEDEEWWKFKISTEKNAYKNLTKEQKQDFENIENGFVN